MKNKIYITACIFGLISLAALLPVRNDANTFHTDEERARFEDLFAVMPPVDSTLIFPKSTACEGCHGRDENNFAYYTADGEEVNVFDDWQASMMANSARDPFWRAKVSHEVLLHPEDKDKIETKCTSCHAPMGHHTNILRGEEHYTIEDLLLDSIGLDGVGCGSCHQMSAEGIGQQNSGAINYDTTRTIYGPYPGPFDGPMNEFLGYNPVYGPHINDAGLCASCHTLLTETYDLEGNNTGATFVEQATYHEWLNSFYEDEQSCQHCHLPQLEEPIVISSGYSFLEGREPFGLHDMVGANTMMLGLMMENKEQLGIEASNADYFQTIEKTYEMLQQKSLDINLSMNGETADSLFFTLELENKAGHKFPSGYPSRRATVEFLVTTETGDTLFLSGAHQDNWEVEGHDENYEPHYDMINAEDQVQIYEMVMGDVNGDVTTVLVRGADQLKDNRLTPLGFTTSDAVYDTTRIVGMAEFDPNFNIENGVEGSGKDFIKYHIPLQDYFGFVNVTAKVWYQSLPPKWMNEMFDESTPEIETFRSMFDNADRSPVLVAQDTILMRLVGTSAVKGSSVSEQFAVFPNPNQGSFTIELPTDFEATKIELRDAQGRLVNTFAAETRHFQVSEKGLLLLTVSDNAGRTMTQKLIIQ